MAWHVEKGQLGYEKTRNLSIMRYCLPLLLSLFCLAACSKKPYIQGRDQYKDDSLPILMDQLSDSLYQATDGRKIKRSDRAVKTKLEAFERAKPALAKEFGADEDIMGRPYAIYLVNGFWIVKSMLPRGFAGGTLVAIIDAETGQLHATLAWR